LAGCKEKLGLVAQLAWDCASGAIAPAAGSARQFFQAFTSDLRVIPEVAQTFVALTVNTYGVDVSTVKVTVGRREP
jgi:hypothetical protein